jgi:hypothetical protein
VKLVVDFEMMKIAMEAMDKKVEVNWIEEDMKMEVVDY